MRALYFAENLLRFAFTGTSVSTSGFGDRFSFDISLASLALLVRYSKLFGVDCLTYVGTEGIPPAARSGALP
jgi:hypothetical protein